MIRLEHQDNDIVIKMPIDMIDDFERFTTTTNKVLVSSTIRINNCIELEFKDIPYSEEAYRNVWSALKEKSQSPAIKQKIRFLKKLAEYQQ